MEPDITTFAASYVLVRVAILCTFGYGVFRLLARSRTPSDNAVRGSKKVGRVYAVPEDRC